MSDAPLAIVIGVTGHRDLRPEDVPALEQSFRTALDQARRRVPHSQPVLLSPLAEGADRLAARVALSVGLKLIVPLPLPVSLYECDFQTTESLAEFRALLARAEGIIRLPLLQGASESSVASAGNDRDREYAKVGAFIASHSQIFFAFWDGTSDGEDKTGGTAQIVQFRLKGIPPPYVSRHSALDLASTEGPVHHIVSPRTTKSLPSERAGIRKLLLPDKWTATQVDDVCRNMDRFNQDARGLGMSGDGSVSKNAAQLLDVDSGRLPEILDTLPPTCAKILKHYAAADALALHFGARTLETSKKVSLGVAAAALLLNIHSSYFVTERVLPSSVLEGLAAMPWYLAAFLVFSAFTALYIYGRAEKAELQNRYQDYRALAEALRIQFFWVVAGIRDPVVDSYLWKQRGELEWLRSALQSWDVMTAVEAHADAQQRPEPGARLELVMHWIQDQRRYFSSKAQRERRQLKKETAIVGWLLKFSWILAVLLAIALSLPLVALRWPAPLVQLLIPGDALHSALMVTIPMLALAGGLLHGYGQQLARSEHIRQFGRMADLFHAGEQELKRLLADHRTEAAVELVRELGLEALDENGDWLILHRERPLEVPTG